MKFSELALPGVFAVDLEPSEDARGTFARTFCIDEFAQHGLETSVVQCSTSTSARRATLRGMHLQRPPDEETKLVRCTRGVAFDVVVDLRSGSPTFGRWLSLELRADALTQLYVPRGCAHGFLTLEDHTQIEYLISTAYAPEASIGFRWDDPGVAIDWPFAPEVLSERDRAWPLLDLDRIRTAGLEAGACRRLTAQTRSRAFRA
jgi:dTDP-4-dehydrorhamnose 3,5-epimerase